MGEGGGDVQKRRRVSGEASSFSLKLSSLDVEVEKKVTTNISSQQSQFPAVDCDGNVKEGGGEVGNTNKEGGRESEKGNIK